MVEKIFSFYELNTVDYYHNYTNRSDRGIEPGHQWQPRINIHFISWIKDNAHEDMANWCDENCQGYYFSPKVWWFIFEKDQDFLNFKKKFNLRIRMYYPVLENLEVTNYTKLFIHLNVSEALNWCANNITSHWGLLDITIHDDMRKIPHHAKKLGFEKPEDAMAVKLRWQ